MKHIAYIRVSTSKQHEGPRAQRDAIDRWSAVHGVEISEYFTEVVSGGAPLDKREVLLDAVCSLEKGDVMVAAKRDRLGRSVMLTAMLENMVKKRKATIAVVEGPGSDDTPENKLMATMIDAFAEYERAVIKARTKAALSAKKARGESCGGNPPYGWVKVGAMLEEHPQEQKGLARMKELREAGKSLQKIANMLTREGFEPRGKSWHITTVNRALGAKR